ncbi:hypothetical protein AB0E77_22325 [Streptomyces sp. NPDC032940]|uniref:hypothetical protein n=1 Tax=Streptomyces sp. NPDC032940 TaxID=3155366 RepID=UPI0033F08743
MWTVDVDFHGGQARPGLEHGDGGFGTGQERDRCVLGLFDVGSRKRRRDGRQ